MDFFRCFLKNYVCSFYLKTNPKSRNLHFSGKIEFSGTFFQLNRYFFASTLLNVYYFHLVLPQILPFEFGEPVDALDMATVNCAVTKGDLPVDVYWKFNGYRVFGSNDGILITRSGQRISVLSIESARSRHSGVYTCIASNSAGSVEHSAELHVNGT